MAQAADRAAAAQYQSIRQTPKLLPMPTFRNLGAGSTASIVMPAGLTYHAVLFRCTIAGVEATAAQIIAQISKIRFILTGDPKIDASGAELAMLARFWNTRNGTDPVNGGILPVWLARPGMMEIDAQDGAAWGTADQGSFSIEVTLAGGATIDAIDVRGFVTRPEALGRHICLRRSPDNQGAAGTKLFTDFGNPSVEYQLLALHIDKAAGAAGPITAIVLKADQVDEWDAPYASIQNLLPIYELAQQTGYCHLPFAMRGRPLDSLPLVMNDARLLITTSAALNNFNVLQERIEGVVV